MQSTSRLFHCCRCHAQVIVCSRCDRGQRYCNDGCAQIARSTSLRRAGQKYQSSRAGRFNNAARQQRFRTRQRQKVTHQGSALKRHHGLLAGETKRPLKRQRPPTSMHCHFCGAVCPPFLRHDFLQRARVERPFRRQGLFQINQRSG